MLNDQKTLRIKWKIRNPKKVENFYIYQKLGNNQPELIKTVEAKNNKKRYNQNVQVKNGKDQRVLVSTKPIERKCF